MGSASAPVPVPHSISGSIAGGVEVEVVPPPDMIRFGPVYGADTEANKKAKELAWAHILMKEGGGGCGYLGSITADIEKQALESYAYDPALNQRKGSDFREMMVKDGCFFIQLALHILGVWKLLGYSQQHPYFGKEAPSASWIQAMFFVGNQIPCVVIRALMKQSFFAKVIKEGSKKGAWKRQPSEDELAKLVLYRTVVEPELGKDGWCGCGGRGHFKSPPTDVLHALHAMLLGPADEHPNYSEMKDFRDLEAGLDDSEKKFPSAGELHKAGITLRKASASSGIANIHFKNWVFWACLYVPPLTIDAHTSDMLSNMAEHERGLSESHREVTAYIRFMRDLAHTYKDFKILENKGIIHVKNHNGESLKGKSLQMLDTIVTHHKCNFTLNFRQTVQMIEGYGGPPWRIISIVLGVFTIIQTIFTVLSYFFPPRTLA